MDQFLGTVLHARQKIIRSQTEINLSGHFLHSSFELKPELKSVGAASKVIWQLLHKYSPSLHLVDF